MEIKAFFSSFKKYIIIVALIGAFAVYSIFTRFLPQFELFSFLAGLLLVAVAIIFFVEFIQVEKELKTVVKSQEVISKSPWEAIDGNFWPKSFWNAQRDFGLGNYPLKIDTTGKILYSCLNDKIPRKHEFKDAVTIRLPTRRRIKTDG